MQTVIPNRIICHAVITLAAVAAALLVGTAWGYTKYRSYYNSASERREIAEGMAWYDENVPQINESLRAGRNFADISEVTADSYKIKYYSSGNIIIFYIFINMRIQIHCAMMIKSHRGTPLLKAMNLKICTAAAWNI